MTQKPTDQILESVSALVDNEASEIELHRILKNIGRDDVVRERWRRYHLIGSVLRREQVLLNSFDVSGAVASAIAQDEPFTGSDDTLAAGNSAKSTSSAWRAVLAKSGVAASFAAVVVLGFQFAGSGQLPGNSQLAGVESGIEASGPAVAVTNVVPLGFELPVPQARTVSTNPAGAMYSPAESGLRALLPLEPAHDLSDTQTQELLNRLLIEHAQRSSVNGGLGILPFARVFKMEESAAEPAGR